MEYFTFTGETYSEALKKATKKYGSRLRVQSKKTVKSGGVFGMGKTTVCELTCYLANEDESADSAQKNGFEMIAPKSKGETSEAGLKETGSEKGRWASGSKFANGANKAGLGANNAGLGANNAGSGTAGANYGLSGAFSSAEGANYDGENASSSNAGGNTSGVSSNSSSKSGFSFSDVLRSGQKNAEDYRLEYYNSIIEKILKQNEFSDSYIKWCKEELAGTLVSIGGANDMKMEDLELMILDKIGSSFKISHTYQMRPQRNVVVLGASQNGKTSLVSKLSWVYSMGQGSVGRNVRIISTDTSKETVEHYGKLTGVLKIGFDVATDDHALSEALYQNNEDNLFFIDTSSKALSSNEPDYKLYALVNVTDNANTSFLLTIPATMKNTDIEHLIQMFSAFPVNMVACTFFDSTLTVGNVISALHAMDKPLVYISNGRIVPKDFEIATSYALLSRLKGFNINIASILKNV